MFKPQPYSDEITEKLAKERQLRGGNFKPPDDLDDKIALHTKRMGLPDSSPLAAIIKSTFDLNCKENDVVFMSQQVWIHVLYSDGFAPEDYEKRGEHLRILMGEVTEAKLGPDFVGDVHYGTSISHIDEFLTVQRYPTRDDKGTGLSKFDCWNPKNGCNIAHEELVPKWLGGENAKQCGTYKKGEEYYTRRPSGGVDLIPITLTNDENSKLDVEIDGIASHLGFTSSQYKAISFGFASIHIINSVKHHGKPARVNMASSHTALEWFGQRGSIQTEWVEIYDTCHGQVWLTGCQLFWKDETRDRLGAETVAFWRPIIGLGDDYVTEIANEFGRNGMTDEVIAQMRKLRSIYGKRGHKEAVESVFQADKKACLKYCKKKFKEVKTEADLTFIHKCSFFPHHGSTLGQRRLEEKHGVEGAKEVRAKRRYKRAETMGDKGRKKAAAKAYKTKTGKDAVEWSTEEEAEMWKIVNDTPSGYMTTNRGKSCISWTKIANAGLFPGRTAQQLNDKAKTLKLSAKRKRKRESILV